MLYFSARSIHDLDRVLLRLIVVEVQEDLVERAVYERTVAKIEGPTLLYLLTERVNLAQAIVESYVPIGAYLIRQTNDLVLVYRVENEFVLKRSRSYHVENVIGHTVQSEHEIVVVKEQADYVRVIGQKLIVLKVAQVNPLRFGHVHVRQIVANEHVALFIGRLDEIERSLFGQNYFILPNDEFCFAFVSVVQKQTGLLRGLVEQVKVFKFEVGTVAVKNVADKLGQKEVARLGEEFILGVEHFELAGGVYLSERGLGFVFGVRQKLNAV